VLVKFGKLRATLRYMPMFEQRDVKVHQTSAPILLINIQSH